MYVAFFLSRASRHRCLVLSVKAVSTVQYSTAQCMFLFRCLDASGTSFRSGHDDIRVCQPGDMVDRLVFVWFCGARGVFLHVTVPLVGLVYFCRVEGTVETG